MNDTLVPPFGHGGRRKAVQQSESNEALTTTNGIPRLKTWDGLIGRAILFLEESFTFSESIAKGSVRSPWTSLHRAARTEQLAQSNLHRVACAR